MHVHFNDELIETTASNLQEIMDAFALSVRNGIAVAVNNKVIQRDNWSSCQLAENDVILVITAAAGG